MHASARVLLFSDPTNTGDLAGKLEQRGYQPLPAHSREDALRIITGRYPDIAIVNAADGEGMRFRHDLNDLRPDGGIPTIVIGATEKLREDDPQVEFLPAAFRDSELFSRLKVLARLVTMQGELALRSETSQLYGLEAPAQAVAPSEIIDAKILVIAGEESRRDAISKMIAPLATADGVKRPHEGMERLLQDRFDAVIAVGWDDDGELLDFCRQLRNHANLFNMPLLVLNDGSDAAEPDKVYEAGASEVLSFGAEPDRLLPRLHHLVRQQRYRQNMQDVYRESRHYAATDSLTGLFGHGYLHTHLQKQILECRSREKDLTVGFFDIADMTGFNAQYGYVAGDRLLRQIGGAIGGFVRAEDLPARFGADKFCIVLPDTELASADPVLYRIASVINMTEFAIMDITEPVKIHLQTGSAMLRPGDSAESLVARARSGIPGRSSG
ncbi:MAG: diguanylate cyclase [Alphaproteobacteria bacterium]